MLTALSRSYMQRVSVEKDSGKQRSGDYGGCVGRSTVVVPCGGGGGTEEREHGRPRRQRCAPRRVGHDVGEGQRRRIACGT